jgi:hypothetical protein
MPGKGRPFPKGASGNPGGRPKVLGDVGVASAKACSDNTLHHARSHRGPAGNDTIH